MAGTWEGLGLPIYGGYTAYLNNSTTSYVSVGDQGQSFLTVTGSTSSGVLHTAVGAYTGAAAGAPGGVNAAGRWKNYFAGGIADGYTRVVAAGAWDLDYDAISSGGTQVYAGMISLTLGATGTMAGGRACVLQLMLNRETGAGDGGAPSVSFINFHNIGESSAASLFTCLTMPANSSPFVTATNTVIDHALKIYVDNVVYYIGLYDATAA